MNSSLSLANLASESELWPRDYVSLPTPQQDAEWIEKLEKEPEDAQVVMDKVLSQKLLTAIKRVERNKEINDRKSVWLFRTFKLSAVAMCLVLGDLILLALRASCTEFHIESLIG